MANLQPAATPRTESQIADKPMAIAAQPVTQPVHKSAVEDAVRQANEFIKPVSESIEFELDQDSGKLIVRMVDLETNQVLRQFPSEEMLALARAMDKLQGLLIHQKA